MLALAATVRTAAASKPSGLHLHRHGGRSPDPYARFVNAHINSTAGNLIEFAQIKISLS